MTGRAWLLAVGLALLALGVGHSPAAAQAGLGGVASSVAGAWGRGDADAIAQSFSEDGVALHLFDESHPAAGVRQARAALSDLLERGGNARVSKVEELGGSPARGFAEIGWDVSSPGAGQVRYVVFLGFVREDAGWKIAEIRVLR